MKTLAFAAAMLLLSSPLQAANIHAGGKCTLVNAIHAANLDIHVGGCRDGRGPDTITLPTKNI